MPLTNFPQGVSSFGIPLIGAGPILTTGKVLFVNNSHGNASNGNTGEDPDRPLSSISAAMAKCRANSGDHIICGPGHVEQITAADQLVLDVAGVTLLGIGTGSNRPTINFAGATTADMNIAAANTVLSNFLFTGGIDALTSPLDIAADDVALLNVEYRDVTGQCLNFIAISGGVDRLLISGFRHIGDSAAGTSASILVNGASTRLEISNFHIDGNFSVAAINFATSASANVDIHDGYIRTRNAADVCIADTITGSTGKIGPNLMLSLNDNAANITEAVTGATWRLFGPIKVVNLDGEQAMDINTTASTDA